jgi:hypothetical protein
MLHACSAAKDILYEVLSHSGVQDWMINYFCDRGNKFNSNDILERPAHFLGRHISVSLRIKVVCLR